MTTMESELDAAIQDAEELREFLAKHPHMEPRARAEVLHAYTSLSHDVHRLTAALDARRKAQHGEHWLGCALANADRDTRRAYFAEVGEVICRFGWSE